MNQHIPGYRVALHLLRSSRAVSNRLVGTGPLFSELTLHLRQAALFQVNTGMRDKEVCQLRWEWEQRAPELDTPEIKRTVFVLPEWITKNKVARVVVLNDVAQRLLQSLRGDHPTYVLTREDRKGRRRRFCRLNNSCWKTVVEYQLAIRRNSAGQHRTDSGRFGCTI
jgi:integrase